MAVDPDEADRELISQNMDTDLQFILSDAGVSTRRQAAIARRYGTLRKFNAIGDDRAQLRTACLQDFAVPQDTPENRAEVAAIVAAWETAKEYVAKEVELRAEAKVLGQPRILQTHERQAMIKAVERVHGALSEADTPSYDYLAVKAEETELNEPSAAPLDEIVSKKRTRQLLRFNLQYKAKHWLHGLQASHFNKFVDFILGDRVLGIQIPAPSGDGSQQRVRPDWGIVLSFEHKLRKEAFRLVTHENHTLATALLAVTRDADLKEAFFTTPVALRAATVSEAPQNKWARFNLKGSSGGKSFTPSKGKGGKSGKGKSKDSRLAGLQLAWRTPDGKFILEHPEDLGTFEVTDARCFLGLPKFDVLGFYKGPLPNSCGHVHKHKLLGKTQNKWNTSPAASYPPGLCEFLAQLILAAGSCGRGAKNQQQAQQQKNAVSSQRQANAVSSSVSSGVAISSISSMHVSSGNVGSSSQGVSKVVCNSDVGLSNSDLVKGALSENPGSSEVVDLTGEISQEAGCEGVDEFAVEKCGNYGKPIKVEWDGKTHDFIDGFGLCSPTRWSPGARGHDRTQPMKDLAAATFQLLLDGVHSAVQDIRKEAFKLVTGKLQESPFSGELLAGLRQKLAALLRDPADALVRDDGQPFFLRLLAQWLEVFEDPDVQCLVNDTDSFASGVNVGVESPLPRSPHVFPPKRKHRKLDGTEFNPIAENYVSAQISSKELESKFREEGMMGRMEPSKLSVLKQEFGDKLRVASKAAILKPDGGVRPLHDATHSVMVNHSIKYQDQLQCPGPAEVAAVVREAIETKEAAFCVSADIKSAHRLVEVRQSDWPYLCCRADSLSETVWINKTGTFGVSSAPYWWAKLFAAIGRFVGHLMQSSPFWHMVYVDDLHGAFTGVHKFEALWVWLLAFEIIGTPFGYHKFKGGFSSDFVGFHLRYDKNEVGITARRGAWLVDWIRNLEEKRFVVAARDCSEFVGRLCFVSQLLVWLKPRLAPLFAWAAVTSAGMVGKLPDTVILTLKYIQSEMVEETFMVSARRPLYFNVEQFRTDAKCTDDCVVLGGWELETRRWFSLKLTRDEVPFLFKPNGGGSQWASTSAELLASLAALQAFGWLDVGSQRRTVALALCAGTDNLANDLLLNKRSTTKWPLLLVNMQLSSLLSKARLSLDLRRRPREENIEADQLTNEVFNSFSLPLRVDLKFGDLKLDLLMMLWHTKAQFDAARQEAKQVAPNAQESRKRKHEKSVW
eukprot:s4940_g1.t1